MEETYNGIKLIKVSEPEVQKLYILQYILAVYTADPTHQQA